jgi:uncharacterized protein (TIGR02444 family)
MASDAGFWDFSLCFYALPGVAPACLRCQDEANADVNLILFALWHATSGKRLHEAEMAAAEAAVTPWREQVVKPLRRLRRALKSRPLAPLDRAGALRKQIQSIELESEHLEQTLLEAFGFRHCEGAAPLDAAKANLTAYATATGVTLPEDAVASLISAFAALGTKS